MTIDIPNYDTLDIKYIVLDYNGTIASNGVVLDDTKKILQKLTELYKVYVITADTFGAVKDELKEFNLEVVVLTSDNHTKEKGEFINNLGKDFCVAMGNGNNDKTMLENAKLSIAIIGSEGCATSTLQVSTITCTNITNALELLINTKKLIATLRR